MVKRKIVMEGNSSSLRNARLKLEKPQNGETQDVKPASTETTDTKSETKANGQVSPPRDKENIPLVNKPGDKRLATPEVIDITDDTGPQSINAYKKQKLDILKYQGLEVTPVSSEDVKPPIAHPPPNVPPTPIVTPQVENFHQRERNKISITVTPDVSLLIKPQASPPTPKLFSNPPLSSNLFSPYQHGTKTVYGNPKEDFSNPKDLPKPTFPSPKEQIIYNNPKDVFNTSKDSYHSPKDLYSSPKDLYNNPKDMFNNPKDLYNNPKDLLNSNNDVYSNAKDLFNSTKDLYNKPKDHFNSPKDLHGNSKEFERAKDLYSNPKDLYKTQKDLFNSHKDLYNNPPKELLYSNPKDLFNTSRKKDMYSGPKDTSSKPKDTFNSTGSKDSFNNANSIKDMFSPNNIKDLFYNPSFRDMLGNPSFIDFLRNNTVKDVINLYNNKDAFPPTPAKSTNYLSPSKDSVSSHYQQQPPRYNNSLLMKSQSPCEDVLDLKVKPHPSIPATLSASGQSLKRSTPSQQQDEVLDLTVKSGKNSNSNLEITLIPPTSHRPYDMKRPLPIPLSRPSVPPKYPSSPSPSPSMHNHNNTLNHQHSMKKNFPVIPTSSHGSNKSKRKSSSSVPIPPTSRAPSHITFPSHSNASTPSNPFSNPLASQSGKNPYMPMLDPMYFAALYSGLFPPNNFMNPALFTPPVSGGAAAGNSTTHDAALNIYKELLKAQNSSLFPNLFNDGATSISLVGNNNKPPSK